MDNSDSYFGGATEQQHTGESPRLTEKEKAEREREMLDRVIRCNTEKQIARN